MVSREDVALLKKDLKLFHKGTKNIRSYLESVQKLADLNPPDLVKLAPSNRAFLDEKKRDAMVTDLVKTMEILTAGADLCAEYAMKSAFACQYIRERVIQLEESVDKIAEKTGVDISTLKTEVVDLKETILPATKRMVDLLDKATTEEKHRKKNGDVMVV